MSVHTPTPARAVEMIERWARDRHLHLHVNAQNGAGAVFSRCGRYRYLLWRRPFKGVAFLGMGMLNPATADHEQDDPTITRGTSLAFKAGMAGPLVWNLFALRAHKPAAMKADPLPIGIHNDEAIDLALQLTRTTIAAWGNYGIHRDRAAAVMRRCAAAKAELQILALTKRGQPGNPLNLPNALNPQPWDYAHGL